MQNTGVYIYILLMNNAKLVRVTDYNFGITKK